MAKSYAATTLGGALNPIENCKITIPLDYVYEDAKLDPVDLVFYAMPMISDSKDAHYTDESVMGRGTTISGYSYSKARSIGMEIPFIVTRQEDIELNLLKLRLLESLVYPIDKFTALAPFKPPPVCTLECGQLLATRPVCAVLTKYSVKFEPNVPMDPITLLPYKFTVGTDWRVVYSSENLPGFSKILQTGY